MSYSRAVYEKVNSEYEGKRRAAEEKAELRAAALHAKLPELDEIDRKLGQTGMLIFGAAMEKNGDLEGRIASIRKDTEKLRLKRAEVLKKAGYPENATDIVYECPECFDTGYRKEVMCGCMKRALARTAYESSGLGRHLLDKTFVNFSLEWYEDDKKVYNIMKNVRDYVRAYADNFDDDCRENLLFIGGTGLGKTHLAGALAKTVIDRGSGVIYESAQNIISEFEDERFDRSNNTANPQKYLDETLLIIDDLGTEVNNQFTVASFYNIINTRINRGLPTVISTNLGAKELRQRYTDRIVSRLLGEYTLISFEGKDVRMQKLSKSSKA